MTVIKPDFLGLLVHQLDECLLAAGEAFGENEARIVAGLDDYSLYEIIDRDAAADRHEHLRTLEPPSLLTDRKFVGQLSTTLLQHAEHDVGRHDLAHRRRRDALVGAFIE